MDFQCHSDVGEHSRPVSVSLDSEQRATGSSRAFIALGDNDNPETRFTLAESLSMPSQDYRREEELDTIFFG